MKFSAGLLGYASRAYDATRITELAASCEALGYDAFWVADQRWGRDVWVLLSACATKTSRIGLGTRVVDPYARHPAITAVSVATLDELSGGRAILGMGAGGSGFEAMGLERRKPVTAIREAVEVIRGLVAGERVELEGEIVRFLGGQLEFRTNPPIPVVIVGRGPKILELGGRIGDGTMIASLVSPEAIRWARGHIDQGAARAGRAVEEIEVSLMAYVSIADEVDRARWIVRRGIMAALVGSYPNLEFLAVSGLSVPAELGTLLEARVSDPDRVMAAIPNEFVERLAIAGTPEQCAAQLRAIADEGVSHLVLAPLPPDGEDAESQLTRFMETVVPQFNSMRVGDGRP